MDDNDGELVQEFDVEMWQKKKEQENGFTRWQNGKDNQGYYQENQVGRATYKDYVFFHVVNPKTPGDPPLKVIRGMVKFFIQTLARDYACRKLGCTAKYEKAPDSPDEKGGYKFKGAKSYSDDIAFAPVYTDNGYTGKDTEKTVKAVLHCFQKTRLKFQFLAICADIPASDPDLLAELGVEKTTSCTDRQRIIATLKNSFSPVDLDNEVMNLVRKTVYYKLKSENPNSKFLLKVKATNLLV